MTTSVRVAGSRVRSAVAGALFVAGAAVPAAAQQSQALNAPLNLSAAVTAAVSTAAVQEPTPTPTPAPTQAETDAKQDSATLNFFRATEVSGFVDMYYSYNFNTPKTACGSSGGVEIFNCLHNFDVTHN